MTVFGVDHAWGRPSVAALKAAGVQFVCRYLSHDTSGKNLTGVEAKRLSDAGLWIVVVWETAADRALAGHAAGVQDARDAAAQAALCGMPKGRPIFFAVDFDATGSDQGAIGAYLDGAASVLGKSRVGIYGGYWPVKRALDGGHCAWAWQTYAWSGGNWDPRAQLQQYSNDHTIDGVDLDYDRAVKPDYGQWKVGVSPTPHPDPQSVEDDMPYRGDLVGGSKAVTAISIAEGSCHAIGFLGDNGIQGLPPAVLRVAVHDKSGWHVTSGVTVDATAAKAVVKFKDPATTDGISVRREDAGNVNVGWDAS